MPRTSFFETHFGRPFDAFAQLNHEQRASALRSTIPDLHFFFDEGRPLTDREAPERTRALASALFKTLSALPPHGVGDEAAAATLRERIVTDALLRAEADRDQNVYLGRLFTRQLTNAVPDVVFQPATLGEACAALAWARSSGVPIALRGAGSTAMGGAVPNDGGVVLDLARLDVIDVNAADGTCVVGAGARLRDVHRRLAERGLALTSYPSNLGGTLAGWFVTGGIGLNALGRGRALAGVLVADVVLPAGEHVRFHADGRADVPGREPHRTTLVGNAAAEWFSSRGLRPLSLADFAGSEGVFGLVLQLTVRVEPRREVGAFLLSFAHRAQALDAAAWIARGAGGELPVPANLKLFSGSHLHHTRRVWADEDARAWREAPGALSSGENMPWTRIAGPTELGARPGEDRAHAEAYLFVDFIGLEPARAFAERLVRCPGEPMVLERESVRVAAERFRPQQTKRLGPGLLAAEILLPADRLAEFLPRAERLARSAGVELDSEVYYVRGGEVLVIAGYLTDHRRGSFALDLVLAPALVDLAMRRFGGRPYVLGRWQAAFFERALGDRAAKVRSSRSALDPAEIVNRGVLTGLRLRGPLGAVLAAGFGPGVSFTRALLDWPVVSGVARLARRALGALPGPAAGRGVPAHVGATFRVAPLIDRANAASGTEGEERSILLAVAPGGARSGSPAAAQAQDQIPEDRSLHCVNCGECNAVCPIFHDAKIRLPQMLTHLGEAMRAGEAIPRSGAALLDLCMRCGNCEEVCQAGIPHLPLYERMQERSNTVTPYDRERHAAVVAAVRSSPRYRREFLDVRGGMYLRRSPVSLPGLTGFVVLRSEIDAGPAATCIHCGACVPVCPTHANREFEGSDPRWVTTVQNRCIGCGSCVEVCPANHANGGQTLRVMEAPAPALIEVLSELEAES